MSHSRLFVATGPPARNRLLFVRCTIPLTAPAPLDISNNAMLLAAVRLRQKQTRRQLTGLDESP
jgi:hypothetical protein